jgi:hypothetical protein
VARPLGPEQGRETSREGYRYKGICLVGLSWVEFQGQSAVQWNEAVFCGLSERYTHGPFPIIFKQLTCYEYYFFKSLAFPTRTDAI